MLVIVPSRGRPHNIKDLIQSWEETRQSAALLVVVDNDDPKCDEYIAIERPTWCRIVAQTPRRLGPSLNTWAMRHVHDADIIGFMGDDHRPRTHGWDTLIKSMCERVGGTGIFYGNDLIQGQLLPTAVFMTSNLIETLGYMCPPEMVHMYLDNVWKLWGERIDQLHYMPNVVIEHMHPVAKKSEWDEGYAFVNSGEMYANDERTMMEYTTDRLETDVRMMRELIGYEN